MDEPLLGGVANAGSVFRRGSSVVRPSSPQSQTIHAYLRALRDAGFVGAPYPRLLTQEQEEFEYIEGDVAIPPYPSWAQSEETLASVAELMRRFHDASSVVSSSFVDGEWNDAFGPWPTQGTVICHFDVCLENVIFRGGQAIALIDFDFAAPGDPVDDLASFARMCVPVDDEVRLKQLGWKSIDVARRLRVVAGAYQLDELGRLSFVDRLDDSIVRAERFVRARVERGEPNFVAMWRAFGGEERFARRRLWFDEHREVLNDSLTP